MAMAMATTPPVRITWAAALVRARAGERVLEIGCGRGALVGLLVDAGARVTAIDRSATAVAAARRANAAAVRDERAEVVRATLEELDGAGFDAVVAVNVNVFWTAPAPSTSALIARCAPGARVVLVYEVPPGRDSAPIARAVSEALEAAGFAAVTTTRRAGAVAITARRPGGGDAGARRRPARGRAARR
jgi:SAM-dependent methyltransferase